MANINALLDIMDKTFDGSTMPSMPGSSTFPITFPENIPVLVEVECTFNQGNDDWRYLYTVEGYIDQYTYNNQYPHLYVNLMGTFNGNAHSLGITCNNTSARFVGTSNEKRFQNGEKTTDYTQQVMSFSFQRSSDDTYTKNLRIRVVQSTIPVIFGDTSNVASQLYSDKPDTYFQTNQSPTALTVNQMPVISSGYNVEYTLNAKPVVVPEGRDFEISIQWTTSTWTSDSQPQITGQPNFQGLRGRITSGLVALYKIAGIDDAKLKYGIKSTAEFFGLQYSNDGYSWTDTNIIPYEFLYRKRENELGTFSYALSFANTDIPIWKNENDAQDYIDGELPIEEAENWPIISPQYPDPEVPGDPDAVTEFGEVGARSIFSQQYIVPLSVLYEIANTFYDTTTAGLWEDIKKGLEMYGDSPIEAIENLSYYPLDLSQVFPTMSQNYIYFGGYQMSFSQGSVNKIINPDGSKDLGSLFFHRINNNWLDFEPYCKLFANIPYCGEYQLDLSEYYEKELSVKYFIDTRTGSCCCCLLANGHLVDKFNGQMGVQMPIKLTDFSAYANSQINTLLGMGGQTMQNMGAVGQTASQAVTAGSGAALAGAGALAVGMGGVMGAKTVYGLAQNNINRYSKTKGGSTSMLNMYMPQMVTFTFERNIPDIPSNFYQMHGYPSNAGGNIGSFSGYLECDQVKLSMPGATESEKDKARALLMSGVFI